MTIMCTYKTPLEIHCMEVTENIGLNDWRNKIKDKLSISYDINNLTMNSIINASVPMLQDYHDQMHLGRLTPDNREPTDKDKCDLADIILALLVELDIISKYESKDNIYKSVLHELKKQYYNTDE